MWRKLAEIASQYLKKGRRVYIEGRLQTRSWEAKEGGKRSRTEIVADNMIMLDGGGAGSNDRSDATVGAPTSQQADVGEELPTIDQGEDLNVEGIPF